MPDTDTDKTVLRRALLAARNALSPEERLRADTAIARRVQAWLAHDPPATLGVYWPLRGEPDLRGLYGELRCQGIGLALPTVIAPGTPLQFAAWAPGEPLAADASGVPAPVERAMVAPDALLIPCVGFTAANIRLGYGGGYYDRTLAILPRMRTAGIAYRCALAEFERADHDIALDVIITE